MMTLKWTGCNHITCKKCRYEWCWICYAKYKPWWGMHFQGILLRCPGKLFGEDENPNGPVRRQAIRALLLPFYLLFGPLLVLGTPCLLAICDKRIPSKLARFCIFVSMTPLFCVIGIDLGIAAFFILLIPIEVIYIIRIIRMKLAMRQNYCCLKIGPI